MTLRREKRRAGRRRPSAVPHLMAACCLLLTSHCVLAGEPSIRIDTAADRAEIVLTWSEPVTVERELDGRDLFMRFDRALAGESGAAIQGGLNGWLETVRYGHRSLLLIALPGVEIDSEQRGAVVTISLDRRPPDAESAALSLDPTEMRLQCLRGAALLAAWDLDGAEHVLTDVLDRDEDNFDALFLMAQCSQRRERWRRAYELYDRAETIAPDRTAIARDRDAIWLEHGDGLHVNYAHRSVGDREDQNRATVFGRSLASDDLELNASLLVVDAGIRGLLDRRGDVIDFDDRRAYLSLGAELRDDGFGRTDLYLHAGESGPGLSLRRRLGEFRAATEIEIGYHEYHLDFIQGIVGGGTRDRLSIRHRRRMGERWSWHLEASGNRYGLEDLPRAATTLGLRGGMEYTLITYEPSIIFGYRFDAEVVDSRAESRSAPGYLFFPLPVVDRRVHTFEAALGRSLTWSVHGSAVLGYTYDPRHGRGVFGAGRLAFRPSGNMSLVLHWSRGVNTERGDDTTFQELGASVRRSF